MAKQVMEYTEQELNQQKMLAALAELGGKLTAEEDVLFRGTKLILPQSMNLREAINFLEQKHAEDEQVMSFSRNYNYRPWDGARATMLALRKAFGAVKQKGTPSMFGDSPPELITIPVSPTETEQIPWGALAVIHLPRTSLFLGAARDEEYGEIFSLSISGPRKFRHEVEGIFRLVDDELKTNSLYRGKAFDGQKMPKFLDLSGVNPDQIIYAEDTQEQLEANIWSFLRYTDTLSELGVPMKRAILLEGKYGTGKTLAALRTAQIATENGWTFNMCRPGQDNLKTTMATARLYQPAVVFFEDIDVIAQGGRDHISELLDIFDGIRSKSTRIMCVLTTNHVERIHKGLMRPGRLDAVIHIGALDAKGIERMIRSVVGDELLDPDMDWSAVCGSMLTFQPAFVKEVINRTTAYNVTHNKGVATTLTTADFVGAAVGMQRHLELMNQATEGEPVEPLTAAMRRIIRDSVDGADVVDGDGDARYQISLNGS